jgi:hypothetical protein
MRLPTQCDCLLAQRLIPLYMFPAIHVSRFTVSRYTCFPLFMFLSIHVSLVLVLLISSSAYTGWFRVPLTHFSHSLAHATHTRTRLHYSFFTFLLVCSMKDKYGIPYIPTMSVAWDSSPRTLATDGWGEYGYPWGAAWHSTPAQVCGLVGSVVRVR